MEKSKGIRPRDLDLREVYVWQLPVRFYHWINAVCIVALCVTGYLIGNPLSAGGHLEASESFMFGAIRFTHFLFAFIFFFNFLFRLYWGFVGNKYARWDNFIPLKKRQWREIMCVIKVDVLQIKRKDIESVGHNSLASLSYFITFLIFLLQSLTGFGMYAAMSDSWFPKLFAWIVPLFGGDLMTRQIHHVLMWGFIIFALIHVYLVFYHDYIERRGVTSSMIGGWKFIEKENLGKESDC
jgi:Ni/Fe-hydrogenase 1 B-type cytochrome subunit